MTREEVDNAEKQNKYNNNFVDFSIELSDEKFK